MEESNSEEDTKSMEMEKILSQALENIEESIKQISKFPIKQYVDKGKEVVLDAQEGTSLNAAKKEHRTEHG